MKILITGPQGSGKTTQSKLLAQHLKIPMIDAGEIIRNFSRENNEDAKKVKEALDKGILAPNDIVGDLVSKKIIENDCQNGYVMDGYPRELDQLQYFDPKYDKVFYLDIADEEVVGRLLKRGREDDTEDLIAKRLSIYHARTEPVLEFYNHQGILYKIDATLSAEQISEQIRAKI